MPTSKDEAQNLNDNKRSDDDRRDETGRRKVDDGPAMQERRNTESRRSETGRRTDTA